MNNVVYQQSKIILKSSTYYLPRIKSGEILLSYLGRVSEHYLIPVNKAHELLCGDSRRIMLHRDFPRLTNQFFEGFEYILGISFDTLINKHTVIPFYRDFISVKKVDSLLSYIRNENKMIGRLTMKSKRIQYCPICVKKDLEIFGETYWRREHNFSTIHTCYIHGCYLNAINRGSQILLDLTPNSSDIYDLKINLCSNQKLVQFERTLCEYLVGKIKFNRDELIKLAISKGLIHQKQRKCFFDKESLSDFRNYECETTGLNELSTKYRLGKIFNNSWNGHSPELYILVLKYLESCPEKRLKNENIELSKFSNAFCHNHNFSPLPVFTSKGPIKYYSCNFCGVVCRYNLSIPSPKPFLVYTGLRLMNEVKKMLKNKTTKKEIKNKLGIRFSIINDIVNQRHVLPKNLKPIDKPEIAKLRKEWTNLLNSEKFTSLNKVINSNAKLYRRLLKYDNDWTTQLHKKFRARNWILKDEKYYQKLDMTLLAKTKESYRAVLNHRPEVRVTISSISRECKKDLNAQKKKIPLTRNFIKENRETHFQFKLRKMANYLREQQETQRFTKSTIFKKFSFRNNHHFRVALNELRVKYNINVNLVT